MISFQGGEPFLASLPNSYASNGAKQADRIWSRRLLSHESSRKQLVVSRQQASLRFRWERQREGIRSTRNHGYELVIGPLFAEERLLCVVPSNLHP